MRVIVHDMLGQTMLQLMRNIISHIFFGIFLFYYDAHAHAHAYAAVGFWFCGCYQMKKKKRVNMEAAA